MNNYTTFDHLVMPIEDTWHDIGISVSLAGYTVPAQHDEFGARTAQHDNTVCVFHAAIKTQLYNVFPIQVWTSWTG